MPTYREVLEAELKPVMDEATMVMAGAAVHTMLKSERPEKMAEQESLEAAADTLVERLDRVFEDALHERADIDGPTPAELIDQSVDRLVVVDRGLRRLARGGGDAAERELVLTVLGVIDGVQQEQNAAAQADYTAEQRAANPKGAKQPANGPKGRSRHRRMPKKARSRRRQSQRKSRQQGRRPGASDRGCVTVMCSGGSTPGRRTDVGRTAVRVVQRPDSLPRFGGRSVAGLPCRYGDFTASAPPSVPSG